MVDETIFTFQDVFSPSSSSSPGNVRGDVGKNINVQLKLRKGLNLKDLGLNQKQARFLIAVLLGIEVKGFVVPPPLQGIPHVIITSPELSDVQTKLVTYLASTVFYKMTRENKSLVVSVSEVFLDVFSNCEQFLLLGEPIKQLMDFSQILGVLGVISTDASDVQKLLETVIDNSELSRTLAAALLTCNQLEQSKKAKDELNTKLTELNKIPKSELAWNEELALEIESLRQNCEEGIQRIQMQKRNAPQVSLKQASKPSTKAGGRANPSIRPKSSNINAKNQKPMPSLIGNTPKQKASLSNIPSSAYRAPANVNSGKNGNGNANGNQPTYSTIIRFRVPKQAPPGCPTSPSMGITTLSNSKNKKTKNKKNWWSLKRDKPILPDNFPFWTWGGSSTMMLTVFEAYQLIWIYAFIEVSVKSYKYNNSIRIEKLQLIKGLPKRYLKKLEQSEIAWLIIGTGILGTILILTELSNINSLAVRSSQQQYFEQEQLRANIPSHERIVTSIDLEPNFAVVDNNQQSSKSDELQEKQHKITSSAESDSLNSSNSKIKRKFKFKIRRKRKTSYFKNRSSGSIKVNQRKKFIPLEERTKTIRDLNSDENQNQSGNEEFKSIFDGYTTKVITNADGTKIILHSDYSKK